MTDTPQPPQAGDRLVASSAPPRPHRPARPGGPVVTPWRRLVGAVAYVVSLVSRVTALALLLYAAFTVFRANPANVWYQFAETLATWSSLGLANLFQLGDPRWTTLVNYGLAALVWLIAGSALAGLIRRAAP
ncbi:hypothetical protein GCM10022224_032090 [Nonomuraea antimicrobica]|uniref:YggT family protein n=1 Tax=Nonomuraea antimicrobica TaxID=561173 RepID=A0ABP7BRQ3_9ACTN